MPKTKPTERIAASNKFSKESAAAPCKFESYCLLLQKQPNKARKPCSTNRLLRFKTGSPSCPDYIINQNIQKMGTVKNVELSMESVRRLLERNHLAYTIKKDSILFNRRFNRRTGDKSYYEIHFTEGGQKIGRQRVVFGSVDYNVYDDDFAMGTCFRNALCTDMAFFAFHFHDLFPDFYPIDEYNDWGE